MRDLKQALAETVEPALDREIAAANAQPPHEFSRTVVREQNTPARRKLVSAGWRAACIVLAAALLCGAAWQTDSVGGFLRRKLGGNETVSYNSDGGAPEIITEYYLPETLPAGYAYSFSERTERYAMTVYTADSALLCLMQFVKSEYRDVLLEDGSTAIYETDSDGRQYLVMERADRAGYSVVWEQNDYVFLLNTTSDMPKDTAYSLCRSLKISG